MKRAAFLLLLLLFCAFAGDRPQYDKPRKQPKLKIETPPGCVWLRDSLFIDEMEIRNLDYLEFLWWTGRNEPDRYKSLLPDTLVDRHKLALCEPYVEYYLRHPAYSQYPVIGVSYAQAVAFCEWRTRMVNRWIYIRKNKIRSDNWDTIVHFPVVMVYRLPTKEEWEYASAAGLPFDQFPQGYRSLVDKDSVPVSNTVEYRNYLRTMILRKQEPKQKHFRGSKNTWYSWELVRAPVSWGTPNEYGIYNLSGNVSEIIADTLVKGLNYENSLDGKVFREKRDEYLLVDSTESGYNYNYTFRYKKPQAWLGFRCVCEVVR
jgi:formylglycine-generating enzyme required for sulfatase activity